MSTRKRAVKPELMNSVMWVRFFHPASISHAGKGTPPTLKRWRGTAYSSPDVELRLSSLNSAELSSLIRGNAIGTIYLTVIGRQVGTTTRLVR